MVNQILFLRHFFFFSKGYRRKSLLLTMVAVLGHVQAHRQREAGLRRAGEEAAVHRETQKGVGTVAPKKRRKWLWFLMAFPFL